MRSRDPRLARKQPNNSQQHPQPSLQPMQSHHQQHHPVGPPPSLLNINPQHIVNNFNGPPMGNQLNSLPMAPHINNININSKQLAKIPKFNRNSDGSISQSHRTMNQSRQISPSKQRRIVTTSKSGGTSSTSSSSKSSRSRSSKDGKRSSGSSDEKKKSSSRKRSQSPGSPTTTTSSSRHKSSAEKSPRHSSNNKMSPNKFKDVKTAVRNRNYRHPRDLSSRSRSPSPTTTTTTIPPPPTTTTVVVKPLSLPKQDIDLRVVPKANDTYLDGSAIVSSTSSVDATALLLQTQSKNNYCVLCRLAGYRHLIEVVHILFREYRLIAWILELKLSQKNCIKKKNDNSVFFKLQ